jgi:hypothetical protein
VRRMNQFRHSGFDGSHHRLRAHRMNLNPDSGLFGFIENGSKIFHLFRGRSRFRSQRHLADVFDAQPGKPSNFGAGFLWGVVCKINSAGWDDAWTLDKTFLNVVSQRDVAFGRTTTGKYRRVTGVEQLLHLLFFIRSGVDVAVTVDKPGYGAHALRIDRLDTGHVGTPGRNGSDAASANDNRSCVDHVAVTNNDPRVGNDEILG